MAKRRFGRIPSPHDPRDYNIRNFIPKGAMLEPLASKKWDFPMEALDQGETTHCVGFSMADFGINYPTFTLYENEDGHEFYYKCKEVDGNPNSEEGSYIRSAAKVLKDIGAIEGYAFATKLEAIKWWLLNKGPIIAGTLWTEGMMEPDENNVIETTGEILGGHAYVLNEWREDDYIGIQNSWGPSWGDNGKAYIKAEEFIAIFPYEGEALAAVELEDYCKKKCCLVELLEKVVEFFKTALQ